MSAATLPTEVAPARERPRWLKTLGYVAFAVVALLFWLYVTFPYEAVQRRLTNEARRAGLSVRMDSIGPGLFGVTAQGVRVSKLASEGADEPASVVLDSLALRPAMFPPGVAIRSSAFGGKIAGSVGLLGDTSVNLSFRDLDPARGNLQALTGLELEGALNGDVSLEIPSASGGAAKGAPASGGGLAFAQTDGTVRLDFANVVIKGGTIEVPYYGQVTPFDVPRITLGNVDGRLVIQKGQGKLEQLAAQGEDLELRADGTIKLANNLRYSETDVTVRIKAQPEFVKRLGIIGAGLSVLPADKQDPSFRVAKISGFIARPTFGPAR